MYEVGEAEGHLFIVMELLAGQTLRARLSSEGPFDPRRLARLAAQGADALGEAHVRGVSHGDVKPENMILLADGRLKLLDFGVARQRLADCTTLTRSMPYSAN